MGHLLEATTRDHLVVMDHFILQVVQVNLSLLQDIHGLVSKSKVY